MKSFDVFFIFSLKKLWNKQSSCRWFEMPYTFTLMIFCCFRKVRVLYGGNELFDYEVDTTFWRDLRLSFLTLGFIILFMFILTSFSAWLTLWGMASIVLSFPLAFFIYRYVFGVLTLGILNGVAAFVIIGIGWCCLTLYMINDPIPILRFSLVANYKNPSKAPFPYWAAINSVGKKLSWFIRHLCDGLYIFHTNLWNLPSDIWA